MKSIKLTGRALVLAEAFAHERDTLKEDIELMQAEAERVTNLRMESYNLRSREIMNAIYDEVGVPHEMRFLNHFCVNVDHIQHKDAYIDVLTDDGQRFANGKLTIDRTLH